MQTCTAEFARLTAQMPLLRCDANPIVSFTSPFALQNSTMPLIEVTLVVSVIVGFVHALRWRRAHGDSSNLVMFFAGIVCLLIVEPFAYFPQWFGVEQSVGLTFVHNKFSVQFLFDRLPLYIVAFYPFFGYTAWVLVQRAGIFRRYNALVGSCCVTFIFLALYEVIDMVGPQLRWWIWNENLATSKPTLFNVPYVNLQAFSIAMPFAMAFMTLLVSKKRYVSGWVVVRNVALTAVLVWPMMWLTMIPSAIIDWMGASVSTSRIVGTWLMVATLAAVTAWAFIGAYRARRDDPANIPAGVGRDFYGLGVVAVYIVVCAVCWAVALPDYLKAVNGFTPEGARTGSVWFALVMAAISLALTWGAYARTGCSARSDGVGALALSAHDGPAAPLQN